jgi:tetratricopeptide (TPR) repeat protein
MAAVHRELKETADERQMLQKHVALSPDTIEPRLRLIEIAQADNDWKTVRELAEQVLAINPLTPAPYRSLLSAADALGDRAVAIDAHRTLLMLNPLDKAEHHYQLGRLLVDEKKLPEAKREVLLALEEAPRFRAAHQLLLKIVAQDPPATLPVTTPATTPVEPSFDGQSAPATTVPALPEKGASP